MANKINFNGNFTNEYYKCIVEDLLENGTYKGVNCISFLGINGINTVVDKNITGIYEFGTNEIRDDVFNKLTEIKAQGFYTGSLVKE